MSAQCHAPPYTPGGAAHALRWANTTSQNTCAKHTWCRRARRACDPCRIISAQCNPAMFSGSTPPGCSKGSSAASSSAASAVLASSEEHACRKFEGAEVRMRACNCITMLTSSGVWSGCAFPTEFGTILLHTAVRQVYCGMRKRIACRHG